MSKLKVCERHTSTTYPRGKLKPKGDYPPKYETYERPRKPRKKVK